MRLRFTKMQGAGNDFVVLDGTAAPLALTLGLRHDEHAHYGREWSPRAYAVWRVGAAWTVKGGASHGFKVPNLKQVVPGARTDPECVEDIRFWLSMLGRAPIVLRKEVPGNIAARFQAAILREAIQLVLDGVLDVEDVDGRNWHHNSFATLDDLDAIMAVEGRAVSVAEQRRDNENKKLSLLGTFLVRSGVLTSVHAFATDPRRGVFILAFLAVRILSRRRLLRLFQVPGLVLLPIVFAWAALHDLEALKWGIFLVLVAISPSGRETFRVPKDLVLRAEGTLLVAVVLTALLAGALLLCSACSGGEEDAGASEAASPGAPCSSSAW